VEQAAHMEHGALEEKAQVKVEVEAQEEEDGEEDDGEEKEGLE
jgi:hypothetical protein